MTAPLTVLPHGTFIKPAGKEYCYCLEVVRIVRDESGREQWQLRRHGLGDDGQPCDDEGGHAMHYLNNLTLCAPDIWRDDSWSVGEQRWACTPLYYIKMEQRGQQDLFAA